MAKFYFSYNSAVLATLKGKNCKGNMYLEIPRKLHYVTNTYQKLTKNSFLRIGRTVESSIWVRDKECSSDSAAQKLDTFQKKKKKKELLTNVPTFSILSILSRLQALKIFYFIFFGKNEKFAKLAKGFY